MTDVLASQFIMYNSREAIANGLSHIEEQVKAIERAVEENAGLAFDLAKAIIESTCRTILTERNISFNTSDNLPRLFKETIQHLQFLPPTVSGETGVRRSLTQTLSGLSTTLQGICELRGSCGFASHGTEGPKPAMEKVHALLAASAADTIVGFLFRVHHEDCKPAPESLIKYEDNPTFNDYIDENHERVRIFEEEFIPSNILYEMGPEPYRLYLAEFNAGLENEEGPGIGASDSEEKR